MARAEVLLRAGSAKATGQGANKTPRTNMRKQKTSPKSAAIIARIARKYRKLLDRLAKH